MRTSSSKKPKVVVIGGGTGTSVVINGLKKYPLDLTTIVTVADSGGSSGRLRDEFGFAPVGDLRQALAALSETNGHSWVRDVLLYRFSKGSGLEGHNLGNLILTALQDMTGQTAKAIEVASNIFRVKGSIYPITLKDIHLVIEYDDGTVKIGEHILDQSQYGGKKIVSVKTSPRATIYSKAKAAIQEANYIIIGPGDLYASILPNFAVKGAASAIKKSSAKLIYVCNLMTRYTQTHNMTASDHLRTIEKYIRQPIDYAIYNNQSIPPKINRIYTKQKEHPVIDDLQDSPTCRVIKSPLLKTAVVKTIAGDKLPRSYLRHHPQKLAQVINRIISHQ